MDMGLLKIDQEGRGYPDEAIDHTDVSLFMRMDEVSFILEMNPE